MDELRKQVRRAHGRMEFERLLGIVGWCLFGGMCLALALITASRFRPVGIGDGAWLLVGLGAAALVGVIWYFVARSSALEAAIEIDRRFELKERVASAMALPPDLADSPAGQALLADASRRVQRIEVGERFAVRPPRQLALPFVPALLMLVVVLFVPPAVEQTQAASKSATAATQQQIKKATEELRKKMEQRRLDAEKKDLKEAQDLFRKITEQTKELSEKKQDSREALSKLNDLSRELEARRKELDAFDKTKRQMEPMKEIDKGPAEKLAESLSKGKFAQALQELQKLQDELKKGNLSEEQKQQLAKQLEQMKEKLEKLAEAQKDAQRQAQQQFEQAKKSGRQEEANRLADQLDQMQKQAPQMQRLQQLAQQMGQCSKRMQQGNGQDAQQAMQGMQGALAEMQQQLEEQKMLDDALAQLQDAKQQCQGPCPNCGGKGCDQCMGQGESKNPNGPPGSGLGKGLGQGARPEEKTDTNFMDSQVRQKQNRGAVDFGGFTEGPNVPGQPQQEVHAATEAAEAADADPLSGRRVPRTHQEHAREYFDHFREGK